MQFFTAFTMYAVIISFSMRPVIRVRLRPHQIIFTKIHFIIMYDVASCIRVCEIHC